MGIVDLTGIDETKPNQGNALTQDVRDNFSAIKTAFDTTNTRTFTNKAAAVLVTPVADSMVFIGGTDGGWFKGVTGGSGYSDNGGSYCGTQFIPTGGDGSAAWLQTEDVFSVESFGAISDAIQLTDAAITASDNTLTSAGASFTSADIGKSIAVFNAGSTTTSLFTTIASINSATSVELTDAAGTTVSGVTAQYGTDNYSFIIAAIDAVHSAGGGVLIADGKFYNSTKVQLRADNIVYDFRAATFYGNNFSCLDDATTTHQVDNVTGYGGTFNPIGDTAAYGGNVNYNGLAFVHCSNVRWYSPRVHARDGTRCLSVQVSSGHGAAPYVNATDVRIYDVGLFGDSDTHDGVDITSDVNGTDMIQDVYIQGFISGCKRGLNNSAGNSTKRHLRINLDLVIKDPDTMGASTQFSVDSKQKLQVVDALVDGIAVNGAERCDFDLSVSGSGSLVNDAITFTDNSADTTNTAKVRIDYDNTNLWTRGLVPSLHDLQITTAYIDGATLGIDQAGFRNTYGAVTFKNCTTNYDLPNHDATMFTVPVVDLGSGANPQLLANSTNRVTTDNGDADATLTVGSSNPNQRWTTALTTTRTADLITAGAYEGAEFHIIRPATGASNLGVTIDGGSVQRNLAASTWSTWLYTGSNWVIKAYGGL